MIYTGKTALLTDLGDTGGGVSQKLLCLPDAFFQNILLWRGVQFRKEQLPQIDLTDAKLGGQLLVG